MLTQSVKWLFDELDKFYALPSPPGRRDLKLLIQDLFLFHTTFWKFI